MAEQWPGTWSGIRISRHHCPTTRPPTIARPAIAQPLPDPRHDLHLFNACGAMSGRWLGNGKVMVGLHGLHPAIAKPLPLPCRRCPVVVQRIPGPLPDHQPSHRPLPGNNTCTLSGGRCILMCRVQEPTDWPARQSLGRSSSVAGSRHLVMPLCLAGKRPGDWLGDGRDLAV
jgi:hypothetical protein